MSEFQKRLTDLSSRTDEIWKVTPKPTPGSAEWLELSDIKQQTDALVGDTVDGLRKGLSPDGFARFQTRLLQFKRTIRAFPLPSKGSNH